MDIHHKIGYGVSCSGAGLSLMLTYKDPSQLSPATKHDFVVFWVLRFPNGALSIAVGAAHMHLPTKAPRHRFSKACQLKKSTMTAGASRLSGLSVL
jgi:hypothetical protein